MRDQAKTKAELIAELNALRRELAHYQHIQSPDNDARAVVERELKVTNQTLQTLIQAAPVAITTLDLNGIIEIWNPAAERIFGWKASEVVGRVLPIVPADRQEELLVLSEYVLKNNDLTDIEVRRQRKDGSIIDISLSIAPLRNDKNQIIGTVRIMVDIVERKRAERRLALQYAVTRILAESLTLENAAPKILEAICKCLDWAVGMFWIADHQTNQISCVETWHKRSLEVSEYEEVSRQFILGIGEGLPGRVWQNLAPEWMTDVTEASNFPRAPFAARAGLHGAFGFPVLFKGELLGVIEFFSQDIRQPDKDVFDMLTAISSQFGQFFVRKLAEENQANLQVSVQQAAQEWLLTFDSIESPILLLDVHGKITRLNRAASDLAARSQHRKIIGSNIKKLRDTEPWQKAAALVDIIKNVHSPLTSQVHDSEHNRAWDISVSNWADEKDRDNRIIIVIRDITEMVELQESVRRSEMMSALGSLVAGVAHEVRNPLFSMTATLDAFEEDFRDRIEYCEYTQVLRGELNRLIELMRELLEYGKPPSKEFLPASLDEIIEQAIQTCVPLAERADVRIVCRVAKRQDLTILTERFRLVQVIQNLLENAIHYSPTKAAVLIEVDDDYQGEQRWIVCSVKDCGPGFRREDLAMVFEPFFTRRHGGTGLGLSIVQRIVEQHGGRISAENLASGGAVVSIRFPALDIVKEVVDVQK